MLDAKHANIMCFSFTEQLTKDSAKIKANIRMVLEVQWLWQLISDQFLDRTFLWLSIINYDSDLHLPVNHFIDKPSVYFTDTLVSLNYKKSLIKFLVDVSF